MKFLNWNIVNLSVRKKCKLLKIHRSNLYYKSKIDISKINKPNHTWAIDITYIKTPVGFVYLMSLIDWKSRFVIASKY